MSIFEKESDVKPEATNLDIG